MSRSTTKLDRELGELHFMWRTSCREFDDPEDLQKLQGAFLRREFYQWSKEPPDNSFAWMSTWIKQQGRFSDPILVFITGGYYSKVFEHALNHLPEDNVLYSIQSTPEAPKP